MSPHRRPALVTLALAAALLAAGCKTREVRESTRERPNFLLIVADDLGYSDLGVYGGEIPTPNLDALAETGTRATDFYVSSRGEPTRAMLLTGVDNHVAGFAAPRIKLMPGDVPAPEQEGRLRSNVVTLPTLLRNAGYHTYMAGKWEIGDRPRNRAHARGFERSFALHDAAASHWSDMTSAQPFFEQARFTQNGERVTELPEDYFSSRYFTDFLIECIEENAGDGRPFFAYLAFQAPHGPLAAPDDWRDRFAGRYDEGYDAIREARLLRLQSLGLVRQEVIPYPGIPTVPSWSSLPKSIKKEQARRMELYAAMVANLDFHVGRLLDRLRELGEYDDTIVVFLSDNGTEPGDRGLTGMDSRNLEWYGRQFPVIEMELWGKPGSFVEYGPGWAQVGMVPFRLFKGTMAEGGVRSPLIVSGPRVQRRRITRAMIHVADIPASILELAGVEHPSKLGDRLVAPLYGKSLVGLLDRVFPARRGPHEWIGMAYGGDRAVRYRGWKLVQLTPPFGSSQWRLFRVDLDPAELWDRSKGNPDVYERLLGLWRGYADAMGVPEPAATASR